MKKVFIDGGANIGQSTKAFQSEWPNSEQYEVYMFEPSSFSKLQPFVDRSDKVNLIKKAIWIRDGEIAFYVKSLFSEGNTLIEKKVNKSSASYRLQTVPCLSLSNFIKENFDFNDEIILKLDIECAEYEVIKDLIDSKAMKFVNILFCEIHGLKCGKTYEETVDLIQLCKNEGIVPYVWDANKFKFKTYKNRVYDKERIDFEHNKWKKRGLK
jgi:FkbM family methyltransferase